MAQVILKDITKRYGNVVAVDRVNLNIADEEFVVLVGPSGCGKSTTLRMIAGLEDISEGSLIIGERVVNDVHPKDRDIAMVFQNYALYPHMTVRDNMAFGLKLRKLSKEEIDRRVNEAARILDIGEYLDRKPKALSGGQRQRVAMGRAIVRDPQVFLFDEPLSNLDARLRLQMRVEISQLHRRLRRTIVYVTHDQVEAMTLADRIVVMNSGVLQQVGTPMEVFHKPVNLFVAGFIGSPAMNMLPVTIKGTKMVGDGVEAAVPPQLVSLLKASDDKMTLGVRPQALRPAASGEAALFAGEISFVEHMGNEKFCHVKVGESGVDCVARVEGDSPAKRGDRMALTTDPDSIFLFDPDGRNVRFARKADGSVDTGIPASANVQAGSQGRAAVPNEGRKGWRRPKPAVLIGLTVAAAAIVALFFLIFGGNTIKPQPAPADKPVAKTAPPAPTDVTEAPKSAAADAAQPAAAPVAAKAPEEPEQPITITLWHAYRGDERDALLQVIDKYNTSHKNIAIRALPVPYDALNDKLLVTLPQGRGPDIFIFAHNMLGSWVEHESGSLVEPITNRVDREELKQFIPLTIKALIFQKALYGLPLNYKSLVLFYNRSLVKQPPQDTKTLLEIAKQNTNPENKSYGLVYEAGKLYFHVPWIHGYGGESLGEDNQPHFDTAAVSNAAVFARSLVQEHKVLPVGMDSYMVTELFNGGKAAMVLNGPWFRAEIKDVDYGVAPMPKVTETGLVAKPFLGSEAVFLSARSANKEWAFKIMQYLTSDESARVRATIGKQPVANVAVYNDPEVQKDPYMKIFQQQAENAVVMPSSRQMQAIWSVGDMALNRALFAEDADPRKEMTEAHQKMVSDVARIGAR